MLFVLDFMSDVLLSLEYVSFVFVFISVLGWDPGGRPGSFMFRFSFRTWSGWGQVFDTGTTSPFTDPG